MGGIRPPVIGVFLTNSIWLLLFGWEKYWAAALVIVAYQTELNDHPTESVLSKLAWRNSTVGWVLRLGARLGGFSRDFCLFVF